MQSGFPKMIIDQLIRRIAVLINSMQTQWKPRGILYISTKNSPSNAYFGRIILTPYPRILGSVKKSLFDKINVCGAMGWNVFNFIIPTLILFHRLGV